MEVGGGCADVERGDAGRVGMVRPLVTAWPRLKFLASIRTKLPKINQLKEGESQLFGALVSATPYQPTHAEEAGTCLGAPFLINPWRSYGIIKKTNYKLRSHHSSEQV